jgi:DNA polymerase-3 subunit delta'
LVTKPPERSFIPIEFFIGDREHRMREGLCHNIALKPFRGGRKIAVIDDADHLNQEGANCLLKTLEEPPPRSVIILIGTSEQRQLPTIRSRCQVIRFGPLPDDVVAELLVSHGVVEDQRQADTLARLCQGSQGGAVELADPELGEFRQQLLLNLADPRLDKVAFTRTLTEFVDGAGKEAPARRRRMRQIISFAAEFYRQLMRGLAGATVNGDALLCEAVASAGQAWAGDQETAIVRLERCQAALAHVDANANQATLLECWIDDL